MTTPSISLAKDDATQPIPPEVRKQAVAWRVELQSDVVTADTCQRWQQWREAHPDHERAWQRVESFGGRLQALPSPLAHAALAPKSIQRRQFAKTMAVIFFTGGAGLMLEEHTPWRLWSADKNTAVGEQASLTLPDGTQVELNSGTAVNIRFTSTERVLHLLNGEILVTTAHEPLAASGATRPFIVQTAQGRLRALGTRFSVRDFGDGDSSRVAVFDGAVEISPERMQVSPRILRADQQARFTRETVDDITAADEHAIAWTQGMIVAEDMPLSDFLAELSRHRPGRLACAPAIARLRVTGTYPLANTDRILTVLEVALPVEIRRITRYWVTVQPRRT
ncbi:FecR domain-containing protein [Undibacterium sp. CY18W]|uniref:FecR domain-containing protein n=1 Tax=Undibacterium hunanense TaxID=2762292 RepID=A0ABR6ZRF8_9BURK|nr:FecR domain-containing protein [Undibacterium hunanense]MBC3918475.1 FecR domain-containing protein [Undibacterium hunanense]